MSAVLKIRPLRHYAPQLAKADRSSGVIVLSTPSLRWAPFSYWIEGPKLHLDQLLGLKQKLRSYVELLYSHGVAYRVKHDFVFPAQKGSVSRQGVTLSGRWELYLGGWQDAELCADSNQLESPGWKKRKAEELHKIERMFELLVMRYEDRQDERDGLVPHRCNKWTLDEQLRRDLNHC